MPSLSPLQKINKYVSNAYLEYPSLEADANSLAWWKAENGWFSNLAYIAIKYLCICGTSVPSERIFCTAGHISSSLRNQLLPENVQTTCQKQHDNLILISDAASYILILYLATHVWLSYYYTYAT